MVLSSASMVYDYLVFIILIFLSLGVAFYSKFAGPKEKTKADYVFATGSSVSMAAMLLSFARGTLGVRAFLGYPSELYYYGSGMYEIIYGIMLAYPIVAYVFVPVYYNLGITSVYQIMGLVTFRLLYISVSTFGATCVCVLALRMTLCRDVSGHSRNDRIAMQYLDLRFKSQSVRCLASGTYILRNILNLGVTVFTPCVALKTVIGLPYWASIIGITAISTLCAVVGGLKAAILADVIQGLIMIGCSLAIIIQGCLDTGGIDYIVQTNYDHGRLKFFNFDMDPTLRVATVSAVFGQLFMSLSIFGCQQNFVQRYCSMDSLKTVRRTLWTNVPVILVLFSLSWVAGMVIFADYLTCDPLSLGYISKIDEIVPFYVEDKFMHIPGLLGVFMASLFNGALSLSVSNLNSMATVAWEDFLSKVSMFKKFKDKQQLLVIKLFCVVLGVVTMGIAFGVGFMSGVIESSQLMTSATSGPLLGVFVLAIFFPGCNWKGAVSGMLLSFAATLWLTFGSYTLHRPPNPFLPLSTSGCNNESFSAHSFPVYDRLNDLQLVNKSESRTVFMDDSVGLTSLHSERSILTEIYSITYMYYSLIGCAVCLIFGLLVSYITGTTEEDLYDERLLHPWSVKVSRMFPGQPRRYLKDNIITNLSSKKNSIVSDIGIKVSETPTYKKYSDDLSIIYNGTLQFHNSMKAQSTESVDTVSSKLS